MISEKKKEELKDKYVGLKILNNQGCYMTITNYNARRDIEVTFDDTFHTVVKGIDLNNFKRGAVNNPNYPTVYGVGISGSKYPKRGAKEYITWHGIIERCYNEKSQKRDRYKTYIGCTACEDWLFYENFYDWIHSQDNFSKWLQGDFSIDKDIIQKGNKIYAPDVSCLVPSYVNNLFTKHQGARGNLPIGVDMNKYGTYNVSINNPLTKEHLHLGNFPTPEDAFYIYKKHKEQIIKDVAMKEYKEKNIIERCYESMMNYQVEITD